MKDDMINIRLQYSMMVFHVVFLILNNPWEREPERGWAYNTENIHIGIETEEQGVEGSQGHLLVNYVLNENFIEKEEIEKHHVILTKFIHNLPWEFYHLTFEKVQVPTSIIDDRDV